MNNLQRMKRVLYILLMSVLSLGAWAQTDSTEVKKDTAEGWQFTTVDSIAITRVKNQNKSGTCWAFSTLGFLESEVLRTKGIEVELSLCM